MKYAGRSAIVLLMALMSASCVQPIHNVARDESFMTRDAGRNAWRKVAVLPFTGEPAFRRVAAEWFAFRLRRHGLFEVVDPYFAEIELEKKGILFGEADTTIEKAQKAGSVLGVDGVVFGSVDSRPASLPQGMPTAGASIVDTATGKVVASSLRSDVGWARYAQERVIAAVDRIDEDFVPVYYAAAGKPWTPPPKEETQGQEPPGLR